MEGHRITDVTYVHGHSDLGHQRIPAILWAHPAYVSLLEPARKKALLSIPWLNIRSLQAGSARKSVGGRVAANTIGFFPPFIFSQVSDPDDPGIWMMFWDQSVQREQTIFFTTGNYDRAERLVAALWAYRDDFIRAWNSAAHPVRRNHA